MAAPAAAAPVAAPAVPATPTHKVFVGNLSFKTREGELQKAFSPAGNVLSANIITRGPRSLGYGFVEFATEAEANKSVTLMNKKELDGREINVEVARPRDEAKIAERRAERERTRAERGPRPEGSRPRRRRGGPKRGGNNRGPRANGDATAVATSSPSTPVSSETSTSDKPVRRAPRVRASTRKEGDAPASQAPSGEAAAASPSSPSSPSAPKRRRSNKRKSNGPRAPRAPRNTGPKIQSTTTLFVANLPFALKDEGFAELFKDTAGVVNAHVVHNKNGRSKGFGFVEYADEDAQKAALEKLTEAKLVSGDRPLSVKIAWNPPVVQDAATSAAPSSTPGAETPTPTPTPTSA